MLTLPKSQTNGASETWIDVFCSATELEQEQERTFASCGRASLSYGQFRRRVDGAASILLRQGVRPGATVAIYMSNSLDFIVWQWAVYRVGCTLLPLYSYYRARELEYCLRDARAMILITKADLAAKVVTKSVLLEFLPELTSTGAPSFSALPYLQHVISVDDLELPGAQIVGDLESVDVATEGLAFARRRTSPFDVMNVMYTSGTTGLPKGGLSMHSNNLASVGCWSVLARLGPDDVILCHVPLFTNFGALYGSCLTVFNRARLVITERFEAAESLRLVEQEHVTYIPGTPEIFRMLLEHPDFKGTNTSSVRGAHVAGSQLPPQLMLRIINELAPDAMQAYGMSECGGLSTVSSAADPIDVRLHTLGRPIASSLVVIRDPDSGRELPNGESGEIWLGDQTPGSCVGKGYVASPQATAEALTEDGWFRTGDLGWFDDVGYLHFAGRRKEMFTVGGFNVYPAEVERYLRELHGISEAYVVGVDDLRLGTVPAAFVIAHSDDFSPEAALKELSGILSSQKCPRYIWVIDHNTLPLNPSGKVLKRELELLARERLGRGAAAGDVVRRSTEVSGDPTSPAP